MGLYLFYLFIISELTQSAFPSVHIFFMVKQIIPTKQCPDKIFVSSIQNVLRPFMTGLEEPHRFKVLHRLQVSKHNHRGSGSHMWLMWHGSSQTVIHALVVSTDITGNLELNLSVLLQHNRINWWVWFLLDELDSDMTYAPQVEGQSGPDVWPVDQRQDETYLFRID